MCNYSLIFLKVGNILFKYQYIIRKTHQNCHFIVNKGKIISFFVNKEKLGVIIANLLCDVILR